MLRVALLALGLLTLVALIWHVGPARILDVLGGLGPGVPLLLLPSMLMYILEAAGWRAALGTVASRVPFWRLLIIRTAGEAVNMTTPAAYVGGEPLKAYLLKRHGVPIVDGMASVITAKTTMTLAEVLFIVTGIALAGWAGTAARGGTASESPLPAAVFSVALLIAAMFVLLVLQRRGLFTGLLALVRRMGFHLTALESRESRLQALDDAIRGFYVRDRRAFAVSLALFFVGWIAEGLEVYAILLYLSEAPPDLVMSMSIAALALVIKGGAFFIPGSLGAQEGGNFLLLMAFGYSDVAGITFAILRRIRELVWIAAGLLCLAALGGLRHAKEPAENGEAYELKR